MSCLFNCKTSNDQCTLMCTCESKNTQIPVVNMCKWTKVAVDFLTVQARGGILWCLQNGQPLNDLGLNTEHYQ